MTIRDLAKTIANAIGFTGEIVWDSAKPDGTPKKQLDASSSRSLGWHAKIQISEGLSGTIAEFQEQFDENKLRLQILVPECA